MPTLEEMKREVARLKAQREVREDFAVRNAEKARVAQQLRQLKHRRLYSFVNKVESLGKKGVAYVREQERKSARRKPSKQPRQSYSPMFNVNDVYKNLGF